MPKAARVAKGRATFRGARDITAALIAIVFGQPELLLTRFSRDPQGRCEIWRYQSGGPARRILAQDIDLNDDCYSVIRPRRRRVVKSTAREPDPFDGAYFGPDDCKKLSGQSGSCAP